MVGLPKILVSRIAQHSGPIKQGILRRNCLADSSQARVKCNDLRQSVGDARWIAGQSAALSGTKEPR